MNNSCIQSVSVSTVWRWSFPNEGTIHVSFPFWSRSGHSQNVTFRQTSHCHSSSLEIFFSNEPNSDSICILVTVIFLAYYWWFHFHELYYHRFYMWSKFLQFCCSNWTIPTHTYEVGKVQSGQSLSLPKRKILREINPWHFFNPVAYKWFLTYI